MSLINIAEHPRRNPLDMVERMAVTNAWTFDRAHEYEVTIVVAGKWTEYQISFTWMFDIEALHLACAFEFKVPERCHTEVQQLVSMINAEMWIGHFGLWVEEGLAMYRHALVLAGGVEVSGPQCEALLSRAIEACEHYFPAFQFVIWAGKSAGDALEAATFKTTA